MHVSTQSGRTRHRLTCSRRVAPACRVVAVAIAVWLGSATVAGAAVHAPGAWRFRGGMVGGAGGGSNMLPATGSDGHGNTWMVYQPSYLQSQSSFPVYGQTANLQVNGQQPSFPGNTLGRVDDKTGELVMDNLQAGTFTVTRRILLDTDAGGIRVTDVIHNGQSTEQQLQLQLSSSTNFVVQQAQLVPDPKRPGHNLAWIGAVPAGPGRAAVDVYAGPGAKVSPTIDSQPGNNVATATAQVTVPANGQVSFVHYHLVATSAEQGTQWVTSMRPGKLLADLPRDVRRSIVNFRTAASLLGDQEVLRGDLLDVVELRNGDRLNGTLTDKGYRLDTFYGTVELPVDRVVGIINTGQYRPRQLLVTADGQIFGGHLEQPTIPIQLTSGQTVAVPLAQVARVGYRKRPTESDDGTDTDAAAGQLRPPYVLLSTGDRVGVRLAPGPIPVVTRYGPLSLSPDVLSGIAFANEDASTHTISLTDGSHFSGLVTLAEFSATLTPGGSGGATTMPATVPAIAPGMAVHFPVGSLNRIVFGGDDVDAADKVAPEDAPALHLRKDDLLVGTLSGPLKVDTAFDTLSVDAGELRSLARSKDNGADVAVTTWDGTTFNGQVQEPTVACHLNCGVDVRVPIDLIDSYTNPSPTVPAMLQEQIRKLVTDLDADDWQARDAAEKQLVKLGPAVAGVLRQVRDKQPPEAQQRIDAVLRQLKK
jgi:hypothetical protein